MSYSSRYTTSYSSRYGDGSSRFCDTTSRYGSDLLKDYSTSRSSDYTSRYSKKDLSSDYSRTRTTLYSSRNARTLGGSDEDEQDVKIEKVDIERIENAKYFGEGGKIENMIDDEEDGEQNLIEEENEKVRNYHEQDAEIAPSTPEIQDDEEYITEHEESSEVVEVEEVVANQTHAMSVSSVPPTQTFYDDEANIPTYEKSLTQETLKPTAVENSGTPLNKTTDELISRSKVSDLIARFNAKCKEASNPNPTNEWKHKHEMGNRTVGKIQPTIFH
ncbi:hypothetical protein DICVIV_13769 [Dictyocaulus viviparus]|uniref:Uncharacterized protein n=1 Tax=Dictyocaulus viviparus TaxID=29172 RepID=A0A0D8X6X7_DICVI|nr:hypothetical protein DICVIV_13769 [Dictyocaulus viviparus]